MQLLNISRAPSDVSAGSVLVVDQPAQVPVVPDCKCENFAALLPKDRQRQSLCHRRHDAVETRSCPRP